MELRLQLLDSFAATGSDGKSYDVCAYDRLVLVPGTWNEWEPSGEIEYRLRDGRLVQVARDGTIRLAGTEVVLVPVEAAGSHHTAAEPTVSRM